MPRRRVIQHRMTITLNGVLYNGIRQLADERELPMTLVVRWALEEYLATHPLGSTRDAQPREAVAV